MKAKYKVAIGSVGLGLAFVASPTFADCSGLPNFSSLKTAVAKALTITMAGLPSICGPHWCPTTAQFAQSRSPVAHSRISGWEAV